MSIFNRRSKTQYGVRCDWCGKIADNTDGAYLRPDGQQGRIVQPEWERFPGGDTTSKDQIQSDRDICEECAEKHCTHCGSDKLVSLTPVVPGPTGWAIRCKDCGHQWQLTEAGTYWLPDGNCFVCGDPADGYYQEHEHREAQTELARLRAENAELAEALRELMASDEGRGPTEQALSRAAAVLAKRDDQLPKLSDMRGAFTDYCGICGERISESAGGCHKCGANVTHEVPGASDLCPVCAFWARDGQDFTSKHHEFCPVNLSALHDVLDELVDGIRKWGSEEDGIPDSLFATYQRAQAMLMRADLTKRVE